MEEQTKGTLHEGEIHPAAGIAMAYIKSLPVTDLMTWMEAFSSNAIEGNRLAEICSETLDRVMKGGKVSDRYLMGLYVIMIQEKLPVDPLSSEDTG